MREKALRNESLDQNNAKDCLQSCGYSGKWTSFLPFRVQLQDVRHRAQKWNVGKSFTVRRIWNKRKGTWNVLRTFRETHAISAMASSTSQGCEPELD